VADFDHLGRYARAVSAGAGAVYLAEHCEPADPESYAALVGPRRLRELEVEALR
jgi:hypothetical protein